MKNANREIYASNVTTLVDLDDKFLNCNQCFYFWKHSQHYYSRWKSNGAGNITFITSQKTWCDVFRFQALAPTNHLKLLMWVIIYMLVMTLCLLYKVFLGCGVGLPSGAADEASPLRHRKWPRSCRRNGRPQLQNLQDRCADWLVGPKLWPNSNQLITENFKYRQENNAEEFFNIATCSPRTIWIQTLLKL